MEKVYIGVDFQARDLKGANFINANLINANFRGATLSVANLKGANLTGADLTGANLSYANLNGATLNGANLSGANFRGANLSVAYLCCANLSYADLGDANLFYANLNGASLAEANFSDANLSEANLTGANLIEADLIGAKNVPHIPMSCPEEGEFIAYKKCRRDEIVKLKIPKDAKRSSATGRKCRCDRAEVISITDKTGKEIDKAYSQYDCSFTYEVGKTVSVPNFCEDRFNECAEGIHFFINRQEAIDY